MRYQYTVITKANAAACHCTYFDAHPEDEFLVRTDRRCPVHSPRCWISGVGKTFEQARRHAEWHMRVCLLGESAAKADLALSEVIGTESATVISNANAEENK